MTQNFTGLRNMEWTMSLGGIVDSFKAPKQIPIACAVYENRCKNVDTTQSYS